MNYKRESSLSAPSSLPRLCELASVLMKLPAPHTQSSQPPVTTTKTKQASFSHTKVQANTLLMFQLKQKIKQQAKNSAVVSQSSTKVSRIPVANMLRQRSYDYEVPHYPYDNEVNWRKQHEARVYPHVHSSASLSIASPYYRPPSADRFPTNMRRYQDIPERKQTYYHQEDNIREQSKEDEDTASWEFEEEQEDGPVVIDGRAERRKAQYRRNQARYRRKRKVYEASLPELLGNLRCEIQELLEIRTQLLMQVLQPATQYRGISLKAQEQQPYQYHPDLSTEKEKRMIQIIQRVMGFFTETESSILHDKTPFSSLEMEKIRDQLRVYMREDVHINGKTGIDAFLQAKQQMFHRFHQTKWTLKVFQDDCHSSTTTTTSTGKSRVVRVYGTLSFKMTYDIICTSFPHLMYEEEANAKCFHVTTPPGCSLIQTLVGKFFDCPMQIIFEMDEQHKVARMIYEYDFIQPLLDMLKNPKLVAFVLSGTR